MDIVSYRPGIEEYEEFRVQMKAMDKIEGDRAFVRLQYGEEIVDGEIYVRIHPKEIDQALASLSRLSQPYQRGAVSKLDPIKDIGQKLFLSLFEGRRETLFRRALKSARAQSRGLRLRLQIDHPMLANLPWESLYDGQDFLCLAGEVPLVRAPVLPQEPLSLPALSTIQMLVVTSNVGQSVTEKDYEDIEKLKSAFPQIELKIVRDATLPLLIDAMVKNSFDIFQFIGTGILIDPSENEQGLPLRIEEGKMPKAKTTSTPYDIVGSKTLKSLLAAKAGVRLAYFNACSSDLLARDLSSVCSSTIGIHGEVTINACQAFTEGMFWALFSGQPFESAVSRGRQQIDTRIPGSREWGNIVAYLQTVDGRLFTQEELRDSTAATLSKPIFSEDGTEKSSEWQKTNALLIIRHKNLEILEKQVATFGKEVPSRIQSQVEVARAEIKSLKEKLRTL